MVFQTFSLKERYLSNQKSPTYEIWCDQISYHDLQKFIGFTYFLSRNYMELFLYFVLICAILCLNSLKQNKPFLIKIGIQSKLTFSETKKRNNICVVSLISKNMYTQYKRSVANAERCASLFN